MTIDNVADYNADAGNADDYADDGRRRYANNRQQCSADNGAATQTTDNNADDYATMQTTFVNNVADYDADADNKDDFAYDR
jgi:hypothetical protein